MVTQYHVHEYQKLPKITKTPKKETNVPKSTKKTPMYQIIQKRTKEDQKVHKSSKKSPKVP